MEQPNSNYASSKSSTIAHQSPRRTSKTRSKRHGKARSADRMPTFKEIEKLVEEKAYNDQALSQANLSRQSVGPSQLESWNQQPERHEWFAYRMQRT